MYEIETLIDLIVRWIPDFVFYHLKRAKGVWLHHRPTPNSQGSQHAAHHFFEPSRFNIFQYGVSINVPVTNISNAAI